MVKLSPRLFVAVALLASFAGSASAQESADPLDRFQLFTECQPVSLVADIDDDDNDLGLAKDDLLRTVRSRLRSARLYTEDRDFPYLLVAVQVVGSAYSTKVKLMVPAWRNGLGWFPTYTWFSDYLGTHSGDSNHVLGTLAKSMDHFIDEYLRVNAEACDNRNDGGW